MTPAFDYAALCEALGLYAARFDAQYLPRCDSTNTLMMQRALAGAPAGSVLVCDEQLAGRGRRGRQWVSRAGDSLCFSLLWHFDNGHSLSGLSLAVGIAVARALDALGVASISLKWPNDIWLNQRKVGGVLVEATTLPQRSAAIIGIGLNLRWHPGLDNIDPPVAALSAAFKLPPREKLLAALLRELANVLDSFSWGGFPTLRSEWLSWNGLQGADVRVIEDARTLRGICEGVDDQGALLLRTEAGPVRIHVGDISLRAEPCTS